MGFPFIIPLLSRGLLKWGLVFGVLVGILWKSYDLGGDHVRAAWLVERAQSEIAHALEIARLAELQQSATVQYLALSSHLKDKRKVLIKEVPIYVTKKDDANCRIPNGFVSLHDKAAGITGLPETDSPSGADDTTPAVELSDVGGTLVSNYSICRRNALQLKELQNWVKKIGQ